MAVNIFMQISTVTGESIAKGFAGAIELAHWAWGMTQSGSTHSNTGSGTGKVSVADLSFTKAVDSTSPTLAQSCCNGMAFETATLTMCKAGGSAPLPFLILTLTNVLISSVQLASSATDEQQMETITLNFGQFKYDYTSQTAAGGAGKTVSMSWNIASNSAA